MAGQSAKVVDFPDSITGVRGDVHRFFQRDRELGLTGVDAGTDPRAARLETDVSRLCEEVEELKARVEALTPPTVNMVIESFAPDPLGVTRPIPVAITSEADGYRAAFIDAGIEASGDSRAEALWNLKDMILASMESLTSVGEDRLGPALRRQFAILRDFVHLK